MTWEGDGKRYQYKIEGSADGQSWTMLSDQTKTETRTQEHQLSFNAKGVRHVRLTATGLDAGAWASLFELEIFGTQMVEGIAKTPRPQAASAQGLLAEVKVPAGFKATLFAAPPDVNYPTCLTATPTGEVLVGIDQNGSLGHDPKNRMEILRCLDTDSDGKADQFIPFAKIGSPRGLVHTGDKLFVLHPPKLTVFPVNTDGSAGEPRVLVSGMGGGFEHPRGADHTTNGIQMGIDGWIYIAVGDFGFPKAIGADGKELQFLGGGIARVRPDGSELEIVSRGQRNIYDVAIAPTLDLFTRDNTNDGGGWNVRLSHVIPTGHYGYPSLFINFPNEIIQPLADYGGGSPCGALYLDEPTLPEPFGRALYTVEWGRNGIMRHPLEPSGAGFKAQQETFVELPRPTDMDVDGSGNLYIASWKDGGFSYSKPDVGYVVRVSPADSKPQPFPDLKKATDAKLLSYLAAPSHTLRFHAQHEILRRGDKPAFANSLEKLALSDAPLGARVAAIFTLKQLRGIRSHDALLRLTKNDMLREFALRSLADRKTEVAKVPVAPFISAAKDSNPRVRLQAAIGLGRLGKLDAAPALLPLAADPDPLVAHVAVHSLASLRAVDACLAALDSSDTKLHAGALRALQAMHDPRAVDGLIARLGKGVALRRGILTALCRLHYREGDWDGVSWWGTRPDTSGPYFKHVSWEASDKIAQALKAALASADTETLKTLLVDFQRHKLEFPEATQRMLALAETDAAFRATCVEMFAARANLSTDALQMLERVAASEQESPALRATAMSGLHRASDRSEVRDTAVRVFAALAEKAPSELQRARNDYVRDGKHAGNISYFAKLAEGADAPRRELAYAVLLHAGEQKNAKKEIKTAVAKVAESAWTQPDRAAGFLRAIGQMRAESFAEQVRTRLADPQPEVRAAALAVAKQLKLDTKAAPPSATIATLPYEQVVAVATKEKGDAKLGGELFQKLNCAACHTVSQKEMLKGPFLGDITTRYNRAQLTESILKPSAVIAQGFEPQWFETKNGGEFDGFVVRESGSEVEIRNAAGVATILKTADIVKRGKRELSIMPAGLTDTLTPQDIASLLAYLESLNKK